MTNLKTLTTNDYNTIKYEKDNKTVAIHRLNNSDIYEMSCYDMINNKIYCDYGTESKVSAFLANHGFNF